MVWGVPSHGLRVRKGLCFFVPCIKYLSNLASQLNLAGPPDLLLWLFHHFSSLLSSFKTGTREAGGDPDVVQALFKGLVEAHPDVRSALLAALAPTPPLVVPSDVSSALVAV